MRYHITSDSEYGAMVGEALRQGIVTKRVVSDREVYYLPGPKCYHLNWILMGCTGLLSRSNIYAIY